MTSYQQRRVEYEVSHYNGGGGHSWSDGYGYQKPGGYGNVSGYSSSGGGYSNGYSTGGGYDSSYANGSGYMSGAGGGGQGQLYDYEAQDRHQVMQQPPRTGMYGDQADMYSSSTGGHFGSANSGDPFCALVPSSFPPGTDPTFIECFNRIDKDRNGFICDQELQSALSTFNQRFSLRTVHLLMYMFTGSNAKVVGPKEFVPLVRSLQTWKGTFQRYDRDRNGRLDERELREALMSMGYNVSPFVLKLLMSKYDKTGFKCAIEYDYFIECCVVVKGLTDKFRAKEQDSYSGTASFTYDEFLLSVLPFIVA